MTDPAAPLLDVRGVRKSFGGLVAVNNVSFHAVEGRIQSVIGPNGAGKTTLFNIVSGLLQPDAGSIHFRGAPITGQRPYQVARAGIARTFQNPSLFPRLSVLENVMLGRHVRSRSGFAASCLRLPAQRREEHAIRDTARESLKSVGLESRAHSPAGGLSFGQRRMVELARALAMEPRLLLLDEPASGLNTREKAELGDRIRRIRDGGVTILLVEHDLSLVMSLSDHLLVLHNGTPVADGTPELIRAHPEVVRVYLGGELEEPPAAGELSGKWLHQQS
ncbi:MAG: ABC transporter ATP-binding protein [Verrucomicrobiota bacterium]